MICDLAETYRIYDYKSLPAVYISTLTAGLREDARIWHGLSEDNSFHTDQRRLLVAIYDVLNSIKWLHTSDGAKGINRPEPLYQKIYEKEPEVEVRKFHSKEEFKMAWEAMRRRYGNNSG